MSRLRRALSFENLFVTVIAFAVLAGGTAFAANQLGKNSVGSKQLKKNSVTAAKIKKNAITGAKIKNGAVTGAKVKDGAIGAAALDPASNPFAGIVYTGTAPPVTVEASPASDPVAIPLSSPTYDQPAGENVFGVGSALLTFDKKCRSNFHAIQLVVTYDLPSALKSEDLEPNLVASGGVFSFVAEGPENESLSMSSFDSGLIPAPSVATNRSLQMYVLPDCFAGGTVTISDVDINLFGAK